MNANFLETLSYQSVGIVIVVGALSLLALAVILVGTVLRQLSTRVVAAPSSVGISHESSDGSTALPPELVAVLTAGVISQIDGPHRIVEIQPAPDVRMQAWSLEGRRQIFGSHRVR